MKQLLFTALFSFCTMTLFAQPILTASTINAVPGDAFARHECDTSGISIGASGSNITWNFTTLHTLATDTMNYVDCASTPYCDSFPGSNLAGIAGTEYDYFTADNNKWVMNGYFQTTAFRYSKPYFIASYPYTYNTSSRDTFSFQAGSGIGYTSTIQTDSNTADGHGTLMLPEGSYYHVLRIHTISHVKDSTTAGVGYQRFESYTWLEPHFHSPMMTLQYDTFGTGSPHLSYVIYYVQSAFGATAVSATAETKIQMTAYPNPVQDELNVLLDTKEAGIVSITLTDISGRVLKEAINKVVTTGKNQISFPVRDLEGGIYLLHVTTPRYSTQQKIVITK